MPRRGSGVALRSSHEARMLFPSPLRVHVEAIFCVRKEREKLNEVREKRGEDPLPTEGQEFDRAVWEECERLTAAASEQADAANSVAEANKKRYDDQVELDVDRCQNDVDHMLYAANRCVLKGCE